MRYASVALALAHWGMSPAQAGDPRRILVLHHLLLGDTLMLTALLAKLRARHPAAEIVMTVSPAYAPLYEGRPYGVVAHAFDPRDFATFRTLRSLPRFDLAILPADNRWSWLARALRIPWIVGSRGIGPPTRTGRSTSLFPTRACRPRFARPPRS
jgi:ADP-heptose:LPS heptosyltransferase